MAHRIVKKALRPPPPVEESPPDAALEEPAAAIAGVDSVVFTAAGVSTHSAQQTPDCSVRGGSVYG